MAADSPGDRAAFAERIRLQVQSRYPGAAVDIDPARYALAVRAPGIDLHLPLAALYTACKRRPARTPALIASFVSGVEPSMVPAAAAPLSTARLLWCVRTRRYLDSLARRDELLTEDIGAGIVAFVAESLPGQVMQGLPRPAWEAAGLDAAAVRRAAAENTAARFATLLDRVRAIERIPADGWRLSGDSLYQGSILMVPALLRAFVERSQGDVLIGIPDRALALVIPAALPGAESFSRRVLQEYRDAMNPCSREVLRSDGSGVRVLSRSRRQASLLPWLND